MTTIESIDQLERLRTLVKECSGCPLGTKDDVDRIDRHEMAHAALLLERAVADTPGLPAVKRKPKQPWAEHVARLVAYLSENESKLDLSVCRQSLRMAGNVIRGVISTAIGSTPRDVESAIAEHAQRARESKAVAQQERITPAAAAAQVAAATPAERESMAKTADAIEAEADEADDEAPPVGDDEGPAEDETETDEADDEAPPVGDETV